MAKIVSEDKERIRKRITDLVTGPRGISALTPEEVTSAYAEAINLEPNNPCYLQGLANYLITCNENKAAAVLFMRAARLPENEFGTVAGVRLKLLLQYGEPITRDLMPALAECEFAQGAIEIAYQANALRAALYLTFLTADPTGICIAYYATSCVDARLESGFKPKEEKKKVEDVAVVSGSPASSTVAKPKKDSLEGYGFKAFLTETETKSLLAGDDATIKSFQERLEGNQKGLKALEAIKQKREM